MTTTLIVETSNYIDTAIGYDTPLDVVITCFPNEKNPRELMARFARQIYGYYVHNVNKKSLMEARELAVKKSHRSTLELDIMIKTLIEQTFRDEVEEMYNISLDIITLSSPQEIHNIIKDMKIVEEAFVGATPEQLSSKTLYKNQRYVVNHPKHSENSLYS